MLREIEQATLLAQGKGWGSGTVAAEVRAGLSLLAPNSRTSPVVLDVGANIGEWTAALLAQAPGSTAYSFEPSTAAFSVLAERFAGDKRVHPVMTAVGGEDGTSRLWADMPGSGLASLYKRRLDHLGIRFIQSEEVSVLTLDSWRLQCPVSPVLLKLDVEGLELAVLGGASNTLTTVEVVQFEFGGCNIDSHTYFQDFYYFFDNLGFRLYRLGPKGLDPVDQYRELDETFATTNYFAQRV